MSRIPSLAACFTKAAVAASLVVAVATPLTAASSDAAPNSRGTMALRPGHRASTAVSGPVRDVEAVADFTVPRLPNSGGTYLGLGLRRSGDHGYRARAKVTPNGRVTVQVLRVRRGRGTKLAAAVTPTVLRPGQTLRLRTKIRGASSVRVDVRAWQVGEATPRVQGVVVDRSRARLTNRGRVRVVGYQGHRAARTTVPYHRLIVRTVARRSTVPVPPPTPTTPAPRPVTPAPWTRPTAANTGVPSGTALTRHDGDIVVTKDGTVLDSLDVHGFVIVKAANVTIRRSVLRGGDATGNIGLVTTSGSNVRGLVVEDSDLYPAHPSVWIDGVKGNNFTARRLDIRGTTDNIKVYGDNVVIVDSYLHDSVHYATDPNQGGGPSHNDGVQVLGGRNITITGNNISGAGNAALQVTQDYSAVSGLSFTRNVVDGGACTVNIAKKPRNGIAVTVADNSFGPNRVYGGCGIVASTTATSVSGSGNVWQSSGQPVTIRRQG